VDIYALNGVYGNPITGGINISIAGGDGANNQWYPSEIDPFAPAESIFYYTASSLSKENLPLIELPVTPKDLGKTLEYNTTGISSSGTGALRVDTGTYRIVYFAFGFEAINSASDRDTVMDRIITWFTQNDNTANDNVVTIEDVTLQPGATQNVPIRLLNSTGVGGSMVTLTFNQSIVTVTSAVAGDFDIFTPDYSNVSDGVLRVTCTKSGQDLIGDLTLATIALAAVGTSGSCELGLYAELTEADGDNVPSRTVNGTFTVVDTTPPASITSLDNLTTEQSHIEWVWNDPTDADFAKVIIYLNGAFETNVSMGAQNYNATGLDPDTEYTISTHTVDEPGNVNQTWMNDTARTKPAPQLHHINVTPTSWTLIITESMNFTATGFDQNNAEISGLVFTWNRSDAYIGNFTTINDTTVNFTAEHVGITYITAKNGGVTSEQVQVTVNDGTSTYQSNDVSSGGSSGGGGGGGASGEAYANIALRERVERQIMKNRFATYRFVKPGTDITFVNFTAMNNYGSVATVVETLHNTSTLIAAAPPGTVYKNINLWVGSAGFATEKNMENVTVSFRVNRSWIDENSVSISTIRLHGYNKSGKTWAPLPVEITGKDESDIHFKSKTTIFNQLAITCPAPVSNPRSAPMSTASLAGTGTHVPEEASPAPFNATSSQTETGTEAPAASASSSSIPGPGVVAVVVAVGSAVLLAWKKRRR
jgi:PGF-pre-PGF domain-containing protein